MLKQAITFITTLSILSGYAQTPGSENIRLNQVGFYPNSPKVAIVVNTPQAEKFFVVSESGKDTVFSGTLKKAGIWEFSQESVSQADFSQVQNAGKYHLFVPGLGNSYSFKIGKDVLLSPGKASLKGFYFQRASTALSEKYAGKWARAEGHPDDSVKVHNSAASPNRPTGTIISSSRGWYDAGDYNKYIVNSGISTGTLLSLYEDYPSFFDTLKVNIPESGNSIPDILDEILWNLRWMMTMQDPSDGGVYHKLTAASFEGMVMPEIAKKQRYVVQKGTAATLDFAAVTAQAARIFKNFNTQLPGLSDSLLKASVAAYNWAKKNPDRAYVQSKLSDPTILTGEYGDGDFEDEFQWANLELFVTTGDKKYYDDAQLPATLSSAFGVPAWPVVNTLGLYSLARNSTRFSNMKGIDLKAVTDQIVKMADRYKNNAAQSPYAIPMGVDKSDFVWGSNSVAANQGILLLNAYKITGDRSYLNAAIANQDYLLGRNATGYSFLTGFGSKSPMNPHHRPSVADKNKEPVPGLMVGGPNPGQQDAIHCKRYKEENKYPATSYIDEHCSYASNEIAINWNAPFAYETLAIEALLADKGKDSKLSETKGTKMGKGKPKSKMKK